jgi:hypothetical protein
VRGYWPLSNLIFAHSGDAEKHLRAIKDRADGRCKLRSERRKEWRQKKEKYRRRRWMCTVGRNRAHSSDHKTDGRETANELLPSDLRRT